MSQRPPGGQARPCSNPKGTNPPPPAFHFCNNHRSTPMKGILAWAIGIPIPIIAILYFMDVF